MDVNSLVDNVWNLYGEKALLDCVDPLLEGKFEEEQMKWSLTVGLACLHPDSTHRPKIRKVLQIFMNPNEPLKESPESRPCTVYVTVCSSASTTTDFGSSSLPPPPPKSSSDQILPVPQPR
ncbi:hypothetical protein SLA2020_175570 [Shorea laevis]